MKECRAALDFRKLTASSLPTERTEAQANTSKMLSHAKISSIPTSRDGLSVRELKKTRSSN